MDAVRNSHRGGRETSPDRAKICRLKQKVKPIRRVQVVYYLTRNGLLEHPHFMEITLSANQPLRLKDVFDRLMALRGSGMPLQYSWSSKRNYKSGYVWCDLAVTDIIHPSEGGEYVLKGSELVEGSCSERFQQLNVSNKQGIHHQQGGAEQNFSYTTNIKSSKAAFGSRQQKEAEEYEEYEEQEKEELLYELDGEKTSYTSSTTTPHSRCSRGVSTTEELDDEDHDAPPPPHHHHQNNKTTNKAVTPHHGHAPPPPTISLAEKLNQREREKLNSNYPKLSDHHQNSSVTSSSAAAPSSRYSVLLQLIACGSSGAEFKAKQQQQQQQETTRLSNVGTTMSKRRESVEDDQKQQPYSGDGDEENMMMIKSCCVPENPRLLGNMQCEEKEYFSGSLVESMKANRGVAFEADQPMLKKSNSYNEERRSRLGMEEVKLKEMEQDKREAKGVKEKCIPLKKSSKDSCRK